MKLISDAIKNYLPELNLRQQQPLLFSDGNKRSGYWPDDVSTRLFFTENDEKTRY